MNPLIKGGIAFGALASSGGACYGIYHVITSRPTYSEILKGTLLNTNDDSHKNNWTARLTSLQAIKEVGDLVEELKPLKTKNGEEQWKLLKTWCEEKIKNSSKGKDNREFKNIQSYCTFSIKEKISGAIEESVSEGDAKWLAAHAKLATIQEAEMNDLLRSAMGKTGDNEKKKAIRDWCVGIYKNPFKGDKDQEFKNALKVCKN